MSEDDRTSPDLGADEHTSPGVGTREAYASIERSLERAVGAIRTLVASCPEPEEEGRERHLEVLSHAFGELGDLSHDSRRVTLQLKREEFP